LGVEVISSFPSLTTSHAQPLPKRATPAALNFVLNSSNEPNAELIAFANSPEGVPPGCGVNISQKKV